MTRTHAFLIDMLYWCTPERALEESELSSYVLTPREEAINTFLAQLFDSKALVRVGFMFGAWVDARPCPREAHVTIACGTVEDALAR